MPRWTKRATPYKLPIVFEILRHIYTHPNIAVVDISYDLRITQANVSDAVHWLYTCGLVKKETVTGQGGKVSITYIGEEEIITHIDQVIQWAKKTKVLSR